jgi:2-C-methyl-D-erythritol 4-phosphate cytidylyltransferase
VRRRTARRCGSHRRRSCCSLLVEAHARATATATDDAALVEALGHAVRVYEGAPSNFKVTTPEDLIIAEALLRERFTP